MFPIFMISSLEKMGRRKRYVDNNNNDYGLVFHTKDARIHKFFFDKDSAQNPPPRRMINSKIVKLLLQPPNKHFAFKYAEANRCNSVASCKGYNGWTIYNPEKEYKRLGILGSSKWRISHINHDYNYSKSYPSTLIVPNEFAEELLPAVGKFRSRKRIPALTWIHPTTGAPLVRCSQPLTGSLCTLKSI